MSMKYIKEKTVYEFDAESFEKYQAYQITLPTIGLERSTYVGILVYACATAIKFIVTGKSYDYNRDEIKDCGDHGVLIINIDDYMRGSISILKLGVIEPNE